MPRKVEYIPFPDIREILRQEVSLNTLPVWGAEGITEKNITEKDLVYVLPTTVSWDDVDEVKRIFRDAAISNLPSMSEIVCGFRSGERVVIPPVFEVFKDRRVLMFGYAAFFAMLDQLESEMCIMPVVEVRRATMKQVPPINNPAPLTSAHFDDYLAMEPGRINPEGKTKAFINPDKYIL